MAAKRSDENLSFQDKLKAWWETDTAKAVATIVAVLLIPASVIAWNYATNQGNDIRNQLNTEPTTADVPDTENEDAIDEETAAEDETEGTNVEGNEDAQNTTGQEPATGTATDESQPAVGGLGSVEKLPNTSSKTVPNYTVVNEDSVYSISMKVCGNDSFYISNMRKNYLKVGETIRVTCAY